MVKYCEETGEFLVEGNIKVHRDSLHHIIQDCCDEYSATKNPLFVWQAINLLPLLGKAIPVWIQNYLTEVSADILENSRSGENFHKNNSTALGLTAKMVSDAYSNDRKWKIRIVVLNLLMKGHSKTKAIEQAMAHFNLEKHTVERAIIGLTKEQIKKK